MKGGLKIDGSHQTTLSVVKYFIVFHGLIVAVSQYSVHHTTLSAKVPSKIQPRCSPVLDPIKRMLSVKVQINEMGIGWCGVGSAGAHSRRCMRACACVSMFGSTSLTLRNTFIPAAFNTALTYNFKHSGEHGSAESASCVGFILKFRKHVLSNSCARSRNTLIMWTPFEISRK